MRGEPIDPSEPGPAEVWRVPPLTRIERAVLLVLVGLGVVAGVAVFVFSGGGDLASAVLQLGVTVAFALFAWKPFVATLAFAAAVPLAFATDTTQEILLALAIAFGCAVRCGSRAIIAAFTAVFLVSTAAVAMFSNTDGPSGNLAAALLTATLAGAIGLLLRITASRERQLADRLRTRDREEQEVVRAERQRIADELHDVIAHDLTIIAMHVRVLDRSTDAATRHQSQAAISDAALKALKDLRRVVAEAEATPQETSSTVLPDAVKDAVRELRATGNDVTVEGSPDDERISRLIGRTLARVLRESVTNILKHGARGDVVISIGADDNAATLRIISPRSGTAKSSMLPSGGYGTVRMTERARRLGGEFASGPDGDRWTVTVGIPLD